MGAAARSIGANSDVTGALFAADFAVRAGPLSITAVGLQVGDGTEVLFPEAPYRRRIRRLVQREGRVLVLEPRPGHIFDPELFAGPSGRPLFKSQPAKSGGAQAWWSDRARAALAHSHPPGSSTP